MNSIKKILLIFIGLLISLIILEMFLQITGFALTTIKEYKNKKLKDPNTITILCLGESTTDGQWPPILQEILDKKAKYKKFRVIDEGHAAKNSEYLLYEIINKNLSVYNPKIVVGMIGINDADFDKPYIINEPDFFGLKTYKLLVLLKEHINSNYTVNFNKAGLNQHIPLALIEKIRQLACDTNNDDVKSLYAMKKITHDYPDIHYYEFLIPALVNPYFNKIILKKDKNYIFCIEDFTDYYKISDHYLELDKIYLLFAKKFFAIKNYYNAILCAKMALKYNSNCSISLKYIINMEKKLNINVVIPNNNFNKKTIYSMTKIIYLEIAEKVFNSGAQLIAMQYPTLPIEQMKQHLKESKYYDKIIFISNEKNFKEALKNYRTEDIFSDMFGGSFGHCTELGNTLIAENVAETILSLYDKE